MKRIFIFILLSVSFFVSYAQTQSGYVRTLGRPDKKGEPLSGVSIRAKGEHNTVLSNEDGNFSLLLTGKKNGDAYSLQQVVKSGYELNESGVIGRPYAFSDKIPLTIVMVSTAQLQAEKIRIENNAYRVAENNYKLRLASLEKQREEKSITAEEYRKEIQDLQDRFEKYQSLISSLAEHYAHTDYDVLDETEREINLCIENGDLERADSLIHTLFNPVDVLKRNSESLARIDRNIRQANEIIRQANEDMAAVLKQQAKDAEYLFQLYTISLARFDNENAARYIETRAQLDTTNVEWQLEAGNFLREYLADYTKAMEYFRKALHHAMEQSGDESMDVAASYNNIGYLCCSLRNYDKALSNLQKALSIYLNLYGNNDDKVLRISAVIYNTYYSSLKQSSKLKKEFKKFISDYAYTLIIDKEDKYYLIEYNNWHLDSEENILDHYQEYKPADIVIMHNGKFGKFHSDNTKGCEIGLKYVGKEEKRHIVNAYKEWKNKQNQ